MELTFEQTVEMLAERLREMPESLRVVEDASFRPTLEQILAMHGVDASLLPLIESEVLLVLSFYMPLSELGPGIARTTGLSEDTASALAATIEALLLQTISAELFAYDFLWLDESDDKAPEADSSLKERLELRPEGAAPGAPEAATHETGGARPLTREELLSALATKRTMAGDIAAARNALEPPVAPSPIPPPPTES